MVHSLTAAGGSQITDPQALPGSLPIATLFASGAGLLANGSAVAFGMDNFDGAAPTAAALVPGGHAFAVLSSASGSLNCGIERADAARGGALLCWGNAYLATRNESSHFEQVCGWPQGSGCDGQHAFAHVPAPWRFKTTLFVECCGANPSVPRLSPPDHGALSRPARLVQRCGNWHGQWHSISIRCTSSPSMQAFWQLNIPPSHNAGRCQGHS